MLLLAFQSANIYKSAEKFTFYFQFTKCEKANKNKAIHVSGNLNKYTMNKISRNFILILILLLSIGQSFSQNEIKIKPTEFFKDSSILLSIWGDRPLLISEYTKAEIEKQKQINKKNELVLTYDQLPDSLENFPDNLNLPIEKRNIDYEEITPYTWKWVQFELTKKDGSISEIGLRRPNWWILQNKSDSVGKKVFLSIPEAGISGQAIVTKIKPSLFDTRFSKCEYEDNKTYRPLTGWFIHNSNDIWNYYFEGELEPICATSNHPFWSIDRKIYIPIGELKVGEKTKTKEGNVSKLLKKEKRKGNETVYNLEIYRDHNYHVGDQGLLVHNSYITLKSETKLADLFNIDKSKVILDGIKQEFAEYFSNSFSKVISNPKFLNKPKITGIYPIEVAKQKFPNNAWDELDGDEFMIMLHNSKTGKRDIAVFSKEWYSNFDNVEEMKEFMIILGGKLAYPDMEGRLFHELGHYATNWNKINELVKKKGVSDFTEILTPEFSNISKYAKINIAEAISEAFSKYLKGDYSKTNLSNQELKEINLLKEYIDESFLKIE